MMARAYATFHVASIDCQIPYDMTDPFNDLYMRSVFELAERETLSGELWKEVPLFAASNDSQCQGGGTPSLPLAEGGRATQHVVVQ